MTLNRFCSHINLITIIRLIPNRWMYSDTCPHELGYPSQTLQPSQHPSPGMGLTVPSPLQHALHPTVDLLLMCQNRDLCWTFFETMGVVTLFALSATCTSMRRLTTEFYRGRTRGALANVFEGQRHADLLELVNNYEARIGGLFAHCVVDPTCSFIPNNLDILTPAGNGDGLRDELLRNWNCTLLPGEELRRRTTTQPADRRTFYMKSPLDFKISITESEDVSLLPVMLTGYTTAECVLLGAHTFTLFYPSLVENGEVLRLPAAGQGIPVDILDEISSLWTLLDSTENVGRPCGECCPNIWRRTLGMRRSATLNWGGFTSQLDSELISGSYQWKLDGECKNVLCKWSLHQPQDMNRWLWWVNDVDDTV
ncbi:hypothetical protein EV361DRAFT_208229 [Lentinula raphanica]|nr:hypothetical protein EV361DRAFT_208229 [Lentinula raphanica]